MIVYDNERELVRCETIDKLTSIVGADRIEVATVGGWNVVVRKGEFFEGQDVLFFEIDSCIPVDLPGLGFLAERGTFSADPDDLGEWTYYHRLKTVRLKGVYSQGLVIPWNEGLKDDYVDWQDYSPMAADLDGAIPSFATYLGVGKWERPVKANSGTAPGGRPANVVGPFPQHVILKTDSERVQNLGKHWDELRERAWVVTEKIDGTSCTAFKDLDGTLHVCSRNWELEDDGNLYWQVTKDSGIADALRPGDKVQFEIAGPGIQGNPLDLSGVQAFVFHYQTADGRINYALELRMVPALAVLRGGDLPERDELLAKYDGLKSKVNPKRLAEGVVLHTPHPVPCLGRSTFKVISNRYLLKEAA